jgi:hypothetical protein
VAIARVRAVLLVGWISLAGCFPAAQPRLPQSVAAAIAERPMRRLETADILLYYPRGRELEARRYLDRVEGCVAHLRRRAHVHNGVSDRKIVTILPELPLNNAFVAGRATGYEALAVVPTSFTTDVFSLEMGLPPDPGAVGCHEVVHHVQLEQIAGFAWFWNALFGQLYTPQIGLDPWFTEGLAVYYETKLQPGTGRLYWPFWRGAFAAAYAGKRINGGDLSAFQRDYHNSNAYLVGSQFIRFLADRYGEDRLWKLVHVQARSIFFPLWVNVRFWQAYDKSLSTLLDEFADEVAANIPVRARPPEQRVIREVREVGYSARYARARDGTEALISADHDRATWLTIYGPDGRVRRARRLTDVLPPRRLAISDPSLTSGLSFSPDGRTLYFVAIDLDPTYLAARLLRYDVEGDRLEVVSGDLGGVGGSISPDGRRYIFARTQGDHHDLAEIELATGAIRVIAEERHGAFLAGPRFSPDGRRLVASHFDGRHFGIVVLDPDSGQRLLQLPTGDAPAHAPSWADDRRFVYLRGAADSAGFQVHLHDVVTGHDQRLTRAPYLAFEPSAGDGRTLRFLNREGWRWTVDEVALPPPGPVPAAATPAEPAPELRLRPPALAVRQAPIVLSDAPYSPFDGLFVPRLYGPTFAGVAGGAGASILGAVLSGGDRLEKHRWSLAGYYQPIQEGQWSGLFAYSNRQLAPLTFTLTASHLAGRSLPLGPVPDPLGDDDYTVYRRDRELALDAFRFIYNNPVGTGFSVLESYSLGDPEVAFPLRRLAGPRVFASYTGADGSAYAGVRRLARGALDLAAYPDAWSTLGFTIVDLRGEVNLVVPLPLSRRHSLSLSGRARGLTGTPAGEPLLLVGGYLGAPLWRRADRPEIEAVVPTALPPPARFVEPLRGFEDFPFLTDRIFVAEGSYRYPFIIDRGSASTLGLLPAFFLRQLDLELFGVAAADGRSGNRHLAAGGALTLRFAIWVIPIGLQYQLARRLTDDQGLVHLILLGPG